MRLKEAAEDGGKEGVESRHYFERKNKEGKSYIEDEHLYCLLSRSQFGMNTPDFSS